MSEKIMKKGRTLIAAMLGTAMIAALTLWGCGTKGYDDVVAARNAALEAAVTTTKTVTALIEPATLKQWMDEGRVNNSDPAYPDKVIILNVVPAKNYAALHIPGSQLLDSSTELAITRMEGVATNTAEVPTGPLMDTYVQRFGITKNTTLVFTVSNAQSLMNATRAYYTFRYWGFPKERLKILNGGDDAWKEAAIAGSWSSSYVLTATVPSVTATTFSVRDLYSGSTANFSTRYSIGEMLVLVDKVNLGTISATAPSGVSIIDVRGGTNATKIQNAIMDDYAKYWTSTFSPGTTTLTKTQVFFDNAALVSYLNLENVTSAKAMNYVYCASGHRASVPFFVLDGMLNWPVTLYDGSSQQWGSYVSTATTNKVATVWQTDALTAGTTISRTFNISGVTPIVPGSYVTLDATSNAMFTSITDPRANQILNEDKAYFTSGGTTTTAPATNTTSGGVDEGNHC